MVYVVVCGGTDGAAGDPTRGARRCDRGGNLIPILPYNRATKRDYNRDYNLYYLDRHADGV